MCGELPQLGEENILEDIVMVIEDHIETKDPLEEEDTQMEDPLMEMEDTLTEEDTQVEDPLTEEGTLVEDPLMEVEDPLEEDILMEMGDPLEEENTLVEDPLMEEDPWTSWRTRTTRPSRTPGLVRPIIVQTSQVTLDTTALENTFDTVGQSMMQLARPQDQTNRQLQQHIQQGQASMQAHTGALQQLAT